MNNETTNCQRCKHQWKYKGNNYYATCPKCMAKVRTKIQKTW